MTRIIVFPTQRCVACGTYVCYGCRIDPTSFWLPLRRSSRSCSRLVWWNNRSLASAVSSARVKYRRCSSARADTAAVCHFYRACLWILVQLAHWSDRYVCYQPLGCKRKPGNARQTRFVEKHYLNWWFYVIRKEGGGSNRLFSVTTDFRDLPSIIIKQPLLSPMEQ